MARIEASLASFEKPDTMPPRLVKEMADAVAEAARAQAKALTAVKADRRPCQPTWQRSQARPGRR
jgi:hypothetical protein